MPSYYKLVRDRIPEILNDSSKKFSSSILSENDFKVELGKKLIEEVNEYNKTTVDKEAMEELADILELLNAAVKTHGSSFEQLEEVRKAKAEKRGGFEKRIFLIEVEDD